MKSLIFPLIFLLSLSTYSQNDEFMATIIGDKEAFLSSKTGEYVFRAHDETDVSQLRTTDNGVIYADIKIHTVKKGETLSAISKKHGVSISDLKSGNKLSNVNLRIGQELKVVKKFVLKSSSPVVSQAEGRIVARLAPGQTPNGMTPPDLPPDAMPGSTINLVVEKDAKLASAKQELETQVENVVDDAKEEIAEDGTLTHTVKSGESLFSIARKYKVSIEDLKKANNLALNTLSVGQKLKIDVYNPAVLNQSQPPIEVEEVKLAPEEIESTDVTVVEEEVIKEIEEPVIESTSTLINESSTNKKETPEIEKEVAKETDKKEALVKETMDRYLKEKESKIEETPTEEVSTYLVKKGDTLWGIAKKHNMSVTDLIALNSLKSNNLSIGQKLKVQ